MKGSFSHQLERILPRYAVLPLAASVVLNSAVYYGGRLLAAGRRHFDLSTDLDRLLPFVPAFIVIYVLSFAFWIVGYLVIGRESRSVCFEVLAAEQISKLFCLVFFVVLPTTMIRPPVLSDGFLYDLTRLIYRLDAPDNLFPSIHCLESWFCFRGAMKCKKVNRPYRVFCLVAALLVFTSTILVKQHVLADVLGGVAAAELGLFLSRKIGAGKLYVFIERKWMVS